MEEENKDTARVWLERSASQGYASAYLGLAHLLFQEDRTEEAREWLNLERVLVASRPTPIIFTLQPPPPPPPP